MKKKLLIAAGFLMSFALWTVALLFVDVAAIGPMDSEVGFSALNGFFHNLTGVHMTLYVITDWLGLIPLMFVMGFGILGLIQWIKRKSLFKVDRSILVLGCFYILVMAAFLFFENFVINYRPILIQGFMEASYPSSTTLLSMCVMPTAIMQLNERIPNPTLKKVISIAIATFTAFMVIGRLISGVHWLSDIIGGALLSIGLIYLYKAFS
jgi:undecaprenyl-diphosphatase